MAASENLKGLTLSDGWYVDDIIKRSPHSTGGCFSCGYWVSKNGKKANEFYDKMCSIDFSGMENEAIFESRMNLYKASVKEYKEHILDTLDKQN